MKEEQFFVAQIGRTIGLYGDLKLHLHTDFPEQFQVGAIVDSSRGSLEIASYNPTRDLVSFVGYSSIDSAKRLTNTKLYSNKELTKENCKLGDGQYFWFDIIGSSVYQGDEKLGEIEDIDRMLDTDYLLVNTSQELIETGLPKSFLVPYIPRYILSVDTQSQRVDTQDAREILESSKYAFLLCHSFPRYHPRLLW